MVLSGVELSPPDVGREGPAVVAGRVGLRWGGRGGGGPWARAVLARHASARAAAAAGVDGWMGGWVVVVVGVYAVGMRC